MASFLGLCLDSLAQSLPFSNCLAPWLMQRVTVQAVYVERLPTALSVRTLNSLPDICDVFKPEEQTALTGQNRWWSKPGVIVYGHEGKKTAPCLILHFSITKIRNQFCNGNLHAGMGEAYRR